MTDNKHRPTNEDHDVLKLLLEVDTLDASSTQLIEDCAQQVEEGNWTRMSERQWEWFDSLAQRFIER